MPRKPSRGEQITFDHRINSYVEEQTVPCADASLCAPRLIALPFSRKLSCLVRNAKDSRRNPAGRRVRVYCSRGPFGIFIVLTEILFQAAFFGRKALRTAGDPHTFFYELWASIFHPFSSDFPSSSRVFIRDSSEGVE